MWLSEYSFRVSEMTCFSLSRDVKTLIVEMLQAAKATSSHADWCLGSGRRWICRCKWKIARSRRALAEVQSLYVEDGATKNLIDLLYITNSTWSTSSWTNGKQLVCISFELTVQQTNKLSYWNATLDVEDFKRWPTWVGFTSWCCWYCYYRRCSFSLKTLNCYLIMCSVNFQRQVSVSRDVKWLVQNTLWRRQLLSV